jgi:hypothetical protein
MVSLTFGLTSSSAGSTKITNTSVDTDVLRCQTQSPC